MDNSQASTVIHLKIREEEDLEDWLNQAQRYLAYSNLNRQTYDESNPGSYRNTKLHCVSQSTLPVFHKHSHSADSISPSVTSDLFMPTSPKKSSILPKRIKFPSMSSFKSFSSSSSSSTASPMEQFDEEFVHKLPLADFLDDDELSLVDFEPLTPKTPPTSHGRSRSLSKVFQNFSKFNTK